MALLKGEAGSSRVRDLMADDPAMCSVNLGEVLYVLTRTHGEGTAAPLVEGVRQVVKVTDPDWGLVEAAARIKAHGGLSYADAFCIATAEERNAQLATGDPEIVASAGDVEVVDLRG